MPKSKPQRTNWKQRALHCEEVIKIQNVLAESREKKHAALLLRAEELRKKLCDAMDYGMELDKQVELEVKLRDEYWNRALAAEKHNALLLEEREANKPKPFYCEICGTELSGPSLKSHPLCTNRACYVAALRINTPPTHWQRFKSWLSRRGK